MIKRILLGLSLAVALMSCSINARIAKADKKFALGEYYKAGWVIPIALSNETTEPKQL